MKPTKDDFRDVLERLQVHDVCIELAWPGGSLLQLSERQIETLRLALRLAANLPSEVELEKLLFAKSYSPPEEWPQSELKLWCQEAARAIMARIEGEKP